MSGDLTIKHNDTTGSRVFVENSLKQIGLITNSTGNSGIYDYTNSKWIANSDANGKCYLGGIQKVNLGASVQDAVIDGSAGTAGNVWINVNPNNTTDWHSVDIENNGTIYYNKQVNGTWSNVWGANLLDNVKRGGDTMTGILVIKSPFVYNGGADQWGNELRFTDTNGTRTMYLNSKSQTEGVTDIVMHAEHGSLHLSGGTGNVFINSILASRNLSSTRVDLTSPSTNLVLNSSGKVVILEKNFNFVTFQFYCIANCKVTGSYALGTIPEGWRPNTNYLANIVPVSGGSPSTQVARVRMQKNGEIRLDVMNANTDKEYFVSGTYILPDSF